VARRLAKAVVGAALCTLARLSGRRVGVALLYHSIADTGRAREDELVPATPTALFTHQLSLLRRRFDIVPASELQAAVAARRPGGRIPVAITFDDDDHSHPATAAPLLREAGLTATFFVNAESLDEPRPLWWQQLQRAWDEQLLDAELLELAGASAAPDLDSIGSAVTRLRPGQRETLRTALTERVGSDPVLDGLSRDQLRALADAGFELGCHTRRHDYLPLLSEEELEHSVAGGSKEIEAIAGRPPVCFAYPSGGWNADVRAAVDAAGFEFAFIAEGGVVTPESDPLALPRIPPPPLYAAELSLEIGRALWTRRAEAGP
jgi:peptidoglycan/xylan/chitin deacetylase (PgdA/CDA1 family)